MPVQKKSLTKSATKPATTTKSVKATGPVASGITAMRAVPTKLSNVSAKLSNVSAKLSNVSAKLSNVSAKRFDA